MPSPLKKLIMPESRLGKYNGSKHDATQKKRHKRKAEDGIKFAAHGASDESRCTVQQWLARPTLAALSPRGTLREQAAPRQAGY